MRLYCYATELRLWPVLCVCQLESNGNASTGPQPSPVHSPESRGPLNVVRSCGNIGFDPNYKFTIAGNTWTGLGVHEVRRSTLLTPKP